MTDEIQVNFNVSAEQKKKLDEIREELSITLQGQMEHAIELWFEKAEQLKKTLAK